MKNDGHGHLADIPSLFVTNSVGLKLKTADKVCSLPVVKIAFEMDQAEISQVTLWLDANNVPTLQFREKASSLPEISIKMTISAF